MEKSPVHDIFNKLVESRKLRIRTGTREEHETLRVRLVKLFSKHKVQLTEIGYEDDSLALSLCADFDAPTGVSSYSIATKRTTSTVEYEILGDDETSDAIQPA